MLLSGQLVTWAATLILAAAYGRFLGAAKFGELNADHRRARGCGHRVMPPLSAGAQAQI